MRKDLLIRKTRMLLGEFVVPMLEVADKPRRRFLQQVIRGILFSGSLVVMGPCCRVRDDYSDRFYRIKRLLNHLVSPRGDLTAAVSGYRQAASPHIQPDAALILDLTDLTQPRARRMPSVNLVRDGREKMLAMGHWCIEVHAGLKDKRVMPLAMDVYGINDPAVGSGNLQIEWVVTAVHQDLQGKGIWVADCGLDRLDAYEMWFSLNVRFILRQRGDRTIVLPNGTGMILWDFVDHLYPRGSGEAHSLQTSGTQTGIGIHAGLSAVNAICVGAVITADPFSWTTSVQTGLGGNVEELIGGIAQIAKKVFSKQPSNSPATACSPDTGAHILGGYTLTLEAERNDTLYADATGVTGGAGLSAGAAVAKGEVAGTTSAFLGDYTHVSGVDDLVIRAEATNSVTAKVRGITAGMGSFAGNVALGSITPVVGTSIGQYADVTVTNSITMTSMSEAAVDVDATGVTVGVGIGIGVSEARATISPDIDTTIGAHAVVTAQQGDITLESPHNYTRGSYSPVDKKADAYGNASGGGILSGNGAVVVATSNAKATTSLKFDANCNVFLALNGNTATLVVDNRISLTYTFAPRTDADGFTHFLREGMVGIGANNAKGQIDNVAVQRIPPAVAFDRTADFSDGLAGLFEAPSSGTWELADGRYEAIAPSGDAAVDLLTLHVDPASFVQRSGILMTSAQGGFVFDYYGPRDFKFVTVSVETKQILLGHRTLKAGWVIDAALTNASLAAATDYKLSVTLKGTTVSVTLDNQAGLSYAYNALVTDGPRAGASPRL